MSEIGENFFVAPPDIVIQPNVRLGVHDGDGALPARFGHHCVLRSGTIVYAAVTAGDYLRTGHDVLIRERTTIGRHVTIGTRTIIEGDVVIGDHVKIQSLCFIPTHVRIGSRVFIGPRVTLTNDRYPLRMRSSYRPQGPVIEDDVTIGGAAVLLPGIVVGRGSFIAAGAIVTKDVPPMSLAIGVPARIKRLPKKLREVNSSEEWSIPRGELKAATAR